MSTTGAHLLVYPYPTSGHVIPLLDLTRRFLSRGLTVTVLVTASNRPLLDPLLCSHSPPLFHHLVFPDPSPFIPSVASNKNRLVSHIRSLRDLHLPLLLRWFHSLDSPPVAVLSDFFLGWTRDFASLVGIKRIVFSPSGAFSSCVTSCIWGDLPRNDQKPEDMDFTVSFPGVPNSPSYPWWQISHIYRMSGAGDPDWDFFRECMLANSSSWGIVFNTFADLERVYLHHFSKKFGAGRVWAVGPVLPPDDDTSLPANRGGTSSVPCHEVMTWLDSRQNQPVVYVCFGSRTSLTCRQMDELAEALDKSGVHFVWSVRAPREAHLAGDYGTLPEGYEDRVNGRGFIIKGWAPQVEILRHRAVAAFLTHCGWNSVLEGLSAGVVMLTWPMSADQFSNAQLLVDQLGVGIRVGEETRKIPESGELARTLAESLEVNRSERVRAKRLQEAALKAINEGGSSDEDLNQLIKTLNEVKVDSGGGDVTHDGLTNGV